MKITWNFHSNFSVEYAGSKVIFDPFFPEDMADEGTRRAITDGTTHVLLTHGHDDHVGSAVDIARENGAMVVANYELCLYLVSKGLPDNQINPGNYGGTVECGNFTTTFVRADHSSSSQTGNGGNIYLGNPAGLILHANEEKALYHMGDTDIFSDMALINELHKPEVGIVPIGDRFTMGGAVAALACKRYFEFKAIIPCHYGSFPIIDQTADTFLDAMGDSKNLVHAIARGESVEL